MSAVEQQGAPAPASTEDQGTVKLEGEELLTVLRNQLEFYFSKQNLATDSYLNAQMNEDRYVKVDVICGFRKLKSITDDKDVVVNVMRQCKNCIVNEAGTMVKPQHKSERNTLILRDIASTTPIEEVREIFKTNEAGKVTGIRSDIGDTWFVTFETQDQCMDTCLWLSNQTFQGQPVRARIKSENLQRSFYYPPGGKSSQQHSPSESPTTHAQWSPQMNGGYFGGPQYGGPQYNAYGQYGGAYAYGQPGYGQPPRGPRNEENRRRKQQEQAGGQAGMPLKAKKGKDGKPLAATTAGPVVKGAKTTGADGKPRREGERAKTPRSAPGKEVGVKGGKKAAPKKEPELGPEHFPALVGSAPVASVGYPAAFQAYSREQMAEVVEALATKGFERPTSMTKDDTAVVTDTPVTECQLLEPFPVMYPASPSPIFAAQPHHSSDLPFLDLSMTNPFLPAEFTNPHPSAAAVAASKPRANTGKRGSIKGEKRSSGRKQSTTGGKAPKDSKQPKYAQKKPPAGKKRLEGLGRAPATSGKIRSDGRKECLSGRGATAQARPLHNHHRHDRSHFCLGEGSSQIEW